MFEAFCREKLGPLVLRVALGLTCVYHGYDKIKAAGGTAWTTAPMPVSWQVLTAWGEFVGGLAVLLGFYCRTAAALIFLVTAGVAVWWQGWNLFGLPLASLEPLLLLLLLSLALVFVGPGGLSLDGRGAGGGAVAAKSPKKR
jgi:uncharacterized membrane protein YphA (DoxX/SURF4 family)